MAHGAGSERTHPDLTTQLFLAKHPGQSANVTFTSGEKLFYAAFLAGFFVIFLWDWWWSSHCLYVAYSVYLAAIFFRLATVGLALFGLPSVVVRPERVLSFAREEWPHYTVLVPLYHEPEVVAKTVRHLDRLDYPRDKLEILLLLEKDDDLTRNALSEVPLPPHFRVIDVPDTQPRTKPKACNWGLRAARGEYLVIYDAEDRPDPDQLKKAVTAFRTMPKQVICLQAKLSFYNPEQNLLTRWFTMEYAAWFDLYLPGLYRLKLPIPLGGTSNHLRRRILEEIGGWDPFNVAEDCDLGIRLHRMGYRTAVLDTTTWEEANSRLRNWVRQRSRWVKGYLQTHLVHSRKPGRTLRDLGPVGVFSFLMSVGGHSLILLVNPLFWVAAIAYLTMAGRELLAGRGTWEVLSRPLQESAWNALLSYSANAPAGRYLTTIFYAVSAILFLANFLFIVINLLGCIKRRLGGVFILVAIVSPLYWVLISLAAWKGFIQLLNRPHYWEKTDHGLFVEPDPATVGK